MATNKQPRDTAVHHVPALSPAARQQTIDRLAKGVEGDPLDVLVIGGGVTGAGAALDSVTRGLSTAIVETRDWASGTSSRSSKLIHGGLRYLEMLDFALVKEALHERGLLLQRLAPHLVHQVPFLYPLQHHLWERFYVGAGVMMYDTLAATGIARRGTPMHRHFTRSQALRLAPGLRSDALVGAIGYYDAQVDDARFTMMLVRTAVRFGALAANRTRVVELLRDHGRVVGARLEDLEERRIFEVRARRIINATGVWTDETQKLAGVSGTVHVRASKGVHLVVPRDRIASQTGMILRTEKSVLFLIPWGEHWIIGTTDTDWDLDLAHPAATGSDIDYLLEHVNTVLASPLTREDVQGVFAGLRPLLTGESDSTSKLSREHVVGRPAPGLIVVAGGKYTTYRVMAKDTVDEAVVDFDRPVEACCTESVPLVGADGYRALWNIRHRIASSSGLPVDQMERLLSRYGSLTEDLLDLMSADPTLAEPIGDGGGYLRVEAVYAATHEDARHLEDVLARRTRISIETWDRGVSAAAEVADLMGDHLGWDSERRRVEVDNYRQRVHAELESQQQPDDQAADATRLTAPEIVTIG